MKHALRQIREFPESGSPGGHGTRIVFIVNFEYALIYLVENGWATIIAVEHTSREPGQWRQVPS